MQEKMLWEPSFEFRENSHLKQYMNWLAREYNLDFKTYDELWKWSVDQPADFWKTIWDYFDVKSPTKYKKVMSGTMMPGVEWFTGSKVNYAKHIFRKKRNDIPAIVHKNERIGPEEVSWETLEKQTAAVQSFFNRHSMEKGDRAAAFIANIPEATAAFLASAASGIIWSSCSPDFGVSSVVDRLKQIEPRVLFAVDGYTYNGKEFDKTGEVRQILDEIPSIEKVVVIPFLEDADRLEGEEYIYWDAVMEQGKGHALQFAELPFDHPIWVLYSSGTTGRPKAITHSHGGVLLEHLKYLAFHNDVHPGERFFWYSTTGWMMWNFTQAALLMGATIVLYDGSAGYPSLDAMWEFVEEAEIHHFGTSAPFLVACMKKELQPGEKFDLSHLRSIGSTGAPLPPEAFDWIYDAVSENVWLCSMSGGTDVCTAFVGGCPLKPVYRGEIQCRALGCAMQSFNQEGEPVVEEVGEMVILKPMPSMPIYFWGDEDKERYMSSYFEMFPGIWRHGDWLKITERRSLIILGRSDATLNRQGVRIGTAEIYRCIHKFEEIDDGIIVNLELSGGRHYMPLFIKMKEGYILDKTLKEKIKDQLRQDYSPRHVPDDMIEVEDIPYTISGKKMEAPLKKILMGEEVEEAANPDSMKNPGSLEFYIDFARQID